MDRHTQKEDGYVKTENWSIRSTSQEHQRFPANYLKVEIGKEQYFLFKFYLKFLIQFVFFKYFAPFSRKLPNINSVSHIALLNHPLSSFNMADLTL